MIREFIKSRPPLKKAASFIAGLPSKMGASGAASVVRNYRECVTGGVIEVSPRNISGRFMISATSHLASRVVISGCYEPEVTELLRSLPKTDGAFVNIGANIGFFSIFAANDLGYQKVISIEPNPEAFGLLEGNVAANGLKDRVDLRQVCVSKESGTLDFEVIPGKSEYSSVGGIVHQSVRDEDREVIPVTAARLLDVIGGEKAGILFVDTEGAEFEVFSGAEDVIRRDRPVLLFECSDALLGKFGSSSRDLETLLESFGYEVHDAFSTSRPLVHPFEGEAIARTVTQVG